MVTAEAEVTPSSETAPSNPSDAEVKPLSDDATKGAEESTSPDAEAAKPEPDKVSTDPQARIADLESRFEKGEPLTAAERTELGRHQQSQRDRQANEQRVREANKKAREELAATRVGVQTALNEAIKPFLRDDLDELHLQALNPKIEAAVSSFMAKADKAALLPLDTALRNSILQITGNHPAVQQNLDAIDDFTALQKYAFDVNWQLAQADALKNAPTAKENETLKARVAELEKQIRGESVAGATGTGSVVGKETSGGSYATTGDLSRAFNKREVTREQYATEYKRLTGRDP